MRKYYWVVMAGVALAILVGVGFMAQVMGVAFRLDWADCGDPDFSHYDVYRVDLDCHIEGDPFYYAKINTAPVLSSDFVDAGLLFGGAFVYRVAAIDGAGNALGRSTTVTCRSLPFLSHFVVSGFRAGEVWLDFEGV